MTQSTPRNSPERDAFYAAIEPQSMRALWSVMAGIITPEPKSDCRPHIWRYADVRARLIEAAGLITAKEAERRVLILENPGLKGSSKVTTSLYCGVQCVLPGEVAPAHRHSQSALRFVLESSGGFTAVGGEKTEMQFGDFVITPNWEWHDHGNTTDDPIFWLDGLDIPVVQFLDASFAEGFGEDQQPITTPQDDSIARFGANMMPMGYQRSKPASPIFNYPYARSREALEQMRRVDEWDPAHGLKMRYVNPVNGDWAMPTIGTCLQLLPKGFAGAPCKSTDATVYVGVEGSGCALVRDTAIDFGPRDVFVVPSWHDLRLEADDDVVLFSYSDRPIQEKLGLFREQRGNQ